MNFIHKIPFFFLIDGFPYLDILHFYDRSENDEIMSSFGKVNLNGRVDVEFVVKIVVSNTPL